MQARGIEERDERGDTGDRKPEDRAEANALDVFKDGHEGEDCDGEAHTVEDVNAEKGGPVALGVGESPELEAEKQGEAEQVAGPPEGSADPAPRADALTLAALHE